MKFEKVEPKSRTIGQALDAHTSDFEELDQLMFGAGIGVAQAIGQLTAALDEIDQCMKDRDYEKASSLGYNEAAHEFVLGEVQSVRSNMDALGSQIALETTGVFEEVWPDVKERLDCLNPKRAE